jgi:O-antigen biosynthesis protein
VSGTVPVSLVVPTVDRPAALARCLDAVLEGDVLPAELVVVDQGGLDDTASVVAACRRPGVAVRHVRAERRGLSAARNSGLAQVTMPWVAFTDDDCVPRADWISALHRRSRQPDAPDAVTGRVLPLGAAREGTHTLSLRVSADRAVFRGRALPWLVGTGGNMALRVDTLRRIRGYDERLGAGTPGAAGEDLDVVHRLLRSGAVIAFDPEVVVFHDRVSAERRLATRRSYGFGLGAFVGVWLRSERWAATVLGRWLLAQARLAARAALHRDGWRLHEARLLVAGAAAGVRYGLALRSPWPAETASAPRRARPTGSDDRAVDVDEL